MIDRVIDIGSVRESEAETEVRDLIAVGGRPAGPVAALSQTSTKPTAVRPLPRGSVTIASRAWPRPCCQTVGHQTDMIFIGTGIGTGTGTGTEIEIENVTEIASESVNAIVTATRIVPLALAVTIRLTVMNASAATAKRNVSAPTAAVSSKRMSMT